MITEKDIESRMSEILTGAGYNVVANEIDEGFQKPAVFVSVYPSSAKLLSCGGSTEEVNNTIEIKYISALETVEDCIEVSHRLKELFLYQPFRIQDRNLTVEEIEFDIEKQVLYVYFDITFIQVVASKQEEYEEISEIQIGGM